MSKRLQGHLTTSNEKTEFTAQDENSLSRAVEAVVTASSTAMQTMKLLTIYRHGPGSTHRCAE